MTHNPYAPPTASVADAPASGSPVEIDPHVLRACTLMWWSFGVSLLGLVFQSIRTAGTASVLVGVISAVAGGGIAFLVTRWITSKLKAGRNWLRLLLTVLNVAGVVLVAVFWDFYKQIFTVMYAGNLTYAALTVVQWVLSVAGIVLINTPGARAWFAAMSRARPRAA